MKTVKVMLPQQSYEIRVASGLIDQAGDSLLELGFGDKAVIVTNPVIRKLYAERLASGLVRKGLNPFIIDVPEGEKYKSLEQAGSLYRQLGDFRAERTTPVIALGGGVIGDLAGFVAATYMRGVPLIQIPTSLLAMVDSSTGGKVAVDCGQLKNMIGSFYQPKLVLADISALKSLPSEEFINGMAEVIKYGLILDEALFSKLEEDLEALQLLDEGIMEDVIGRSIEIKARVVEKDEKDTGLRNILNFGHTVGHAIESISDFSIKHGCAVGTGMFAEGLISLKMGLLSQSDFERMAALLKKAGLPGRLKGLDPAKIIQAMSHDKKVSGGRIRFVLLKGIGETLISDGVSISLVEQVLREMNE